MIYYYNLKPLYAGVLMVFFQLSMGRIIAIYVANSIIFTFFIFLAYKILKQSKKKQNVYFSMMYISVAIGIFINFIYAPMTDPNLIIFLNFLTNYFITLGTIFLTVFVLILLKTEKVFTTIKQFTLILIYAILLFFMIVIPDGVEVGPHTGWSPHWSWPLFIYVAIVITCMSVGPSLIYSIKLYNKFEDELIKRKWKFFIIGMSELFAVLYGTFFTHALNISLIRSIWAIIALILSLTGAYLIYYGVAKKFKTD